MKTIGVLWGFREEKELREAGAHYIIDRPDQVLDNDHRGLKKNSLYVFCAFFRSAQCRHIRLLAFQFNK